MLPNKIIIAGVLFLITLISGLFLSHAGRPLNSALFTVHKLVSIAAVVLLVIAAIQLYKDGEAGTPLQLIMMIVTGMLFLALVVSGALLSFDSMKTVVVLIVHQVAPLLSLASSAATLYLLHGGKA